jgi:hypothetical protein
MQMKYFFRAIKVSPFDNFKSWRQHIRGRLQANYEYDHMVGLVQNFANRLGLKICLNLRNTVLFIQEVGVLLGLITGMMMQGWVDILASSSKMTNMTTVGWLE